jgi:hypothetical protein
MGEGISRWEIAAFVDHDGWCGHQRQICRAKRQASEAGWFVVQFGADCLRSSQRKSFVETEHGTCPHERTRGLGRGWAWLGFPLPQIVEHPSE